MIIFRSLSEIKDIDRTVVALGNFDGVHIGHQALIDRAVKIAHEKNLKSAVFTFSNHPKNVLSHSNVVRNIIYEDEKMRILERLGIDYVFSMDFDEYMMSMSPDEFIEKLMIGTFRADTAVCGFNFTFGSRAAGTADYLRDYCRDHDLNVIVVDRVNLGGCVVSSTLIRQQILDGNMEEVSGLLGRTYSIRGTVVKGNALGRTIGFPTCNITIDETMVSPPNGAYITRCKVGGEVFKSITNVGNKPTIGTYSKSIETHIFDFDRDIYGELMEVEFIKMIREERKFPSLDELAAQLDNDVKVAKSYHERTL